MINDFEDIHVQDSPASRTSTSHVAAFKQSSESKKLESRLLNVRKLSAELVSVLLGNAKYDNWPQFIKEKNKEKIRKLKCIYI